MDIHHVASLIAAARENWLSTNRPDLVAQLDAGFGSQLNPNLPSNLTQHPQPKIRVRLPQFHPPQQPP